MAEIKLLIAEDDPTLSRLLAEWLSGEPDITVAARALDGEQAVALAHQHRPGVVLMDVGMPRLDGIAATRKIREAQPECAVVVLTIHGDDEHVFSAIKAGASGYVLKSASADQIVQAVRAAAAGEGYLDQSLVRKVMDEFARVGRLRASARHVFAELTRREVEVLDLVSHGRRNREIADQLSLSIKTVKSHVSSIIAKLHVNDRTEAALLAAQHGMSDPD